MLRIENTPASEYSLKFLQGMLNAMGLSFHKYGKVEDAYPAKLDAVESLQIRLEKYAETGNTEFLVDVANFAMIEFMHPRHPQAHYRATTQEESPGRASVSGVVSQRANDEVE